MLVIERIYFASWREERPTQILILKTHNAGMISKLVPSIGNWSFKDVTQYRHHLGKIWWFSHIFILHMFQFSYWKCFFHACFINNLGEESKSIESNSKLITICQYPSCCGATFGHGEESTISPRKCKLENWQSLSGIRKNRKRKEKGDGLARKKMGRNGKWENDFFVGLISFNHKNCFLFWFWFWSFWSKHTPSTSYTGSK